MKKRRDHLKAVPGSRQTAAEPVDFVLADEVPVGSIALAELEKQIGDDGYVNNVGRKLVGLSMLCVAIAVALIAYVAGHQLRAIAYGVAVILMLSGIWLFATAALAKRPGC